MAISFSLQLLEIDDLPMSSIKCWGSAYLSQFSMMQTREQMISAATDLSEMQRYLIELVRKKMATPGDDMLSAITNFRVPGEEPLGFDAIVATTSSLLINPHHSLSTAFSTNLSTFSTATHHSKHFYTNQHREQ